MFPDGTLTNTTKSPQVREKTLQRSWGGGAAWRIQGTRESQVWPERSEQASWWEPKKTSEGMQTGRTEQANVGRTWASALSQMGATVDFKQRSNAVWLTLNRSRQGWETEETTVKWRTTGGGWGWGVWRWQWRLGRLVQWSRQEWWGSQSRWQSWKQWAVGGIWEWF